jgi:hypothetical protein
MDKTFKLTNPLPEAQGKAENDHWPTPPLLAKQALSFAINLLPNPSVPISILEPGAGDRAPFLTAATDSSSLLFTARGIEYRDVEVPEHLNGKTIWHKNCDYLKWSIDNQKRPDLIITNPPFSLAQEFIEHSIDMVKPDGIVVMLLQTGFEGSVKRREFWGQNKPFKRLLVRPRPSFGGGSDSREYGIYFWAGRTLDTFLHQTGRNHCDMDFIDNDGPWSKL